MQKDTGAWTRNRIARERVKDAARLAKRELEIAGVAEDPWPAGLPPEQCGEVVLLATDHDREPTADGWF